MPSQVDLDTLLTSIIGKLDDEVGNLLGGEIHFSTGSSRIITKEDFFSASRENSVLVRLEVSGEQSAESFAVLRLKDAILLGGSLIMLPDEQIRQKIESGHLVEEEANAFGEIANSLASTCTHALRDQTEEKFQFTRSAVSELAPADVDVAAAEPFAPGSYALCQIVMTFKEEPLGDLEFIFPLALLGLADDQNTAQEAEGEDEFSDSRATDRTLYAALQQIQEQISEFLGQELIFSEHNNRYITKKEFFTPPPDYGVVVNMVVSGAANGTAYVLVDLKSAIILGATLIMRPPDQIAKRLVKATLDGEEADAFGEIANLAAGVYAQVFPETHPRKLHFKRDDVASFDGEAIALDSDEPVPPGNYYLSSCAMHLGEQDLGRFDVLFPLDVLGISPPKPKKPADGGKSAEETPGRSDASVLIVADDEEQAQIFVKSLTALGLTCQNITFQDNFRTALREHSVAGVFLIMAEVEDRAFATAIKVRSELSDDQPMIVAGPEWTRSKVLKALKYGACDILITPAETEEITEKARRHMGKTLASVD